MLNSGVAVVGIATAMAEIPDLPRRWQTGEAPHALPAPVKWSDKTLTLLARMALIKRRMHALSRDRTRNVRYSPPLVAAHRSFEHPPHSAELSCLVTATLMTAATAEKPSPHKNPSFLISLRKICKKSPLWILRF